MKKGGSPALKWIYGYTKRQLWQVVLLALITGAISFGFILLALCSRHVLDIVTGDASGSLFAAVFAIFAIIAGQGALNVLYSVIILRAYNNIDIRMKQGIFQSLLKKKQTNIGRYHSGEILNRMTNDLDVVVTAVVSLIPEGISLGVRLVAGLAVLVSIDWRFTLVVLGAGLFVAAAARLYSRHFKYLHKQQQEEAGRVRSYIQECLENMPIIKSFSNDKRVCESLYERQKRHYHVSMKRNMVGNVASTAVYIMFTGGYYAALVWGALQIKGGVITFGTLTAFLQIIDQIKGPMKNMSGLIPQFYSMLASAERMMELEEMENEKGEERPESAFELYEKTEAIVLENVSFAYKDEKVLEKADMCIEKGITAAVAGASGIGKSTMMKLLLDLIEPDEGSVYFRTKDGMLPADRGTRYLFAYVPQGNMILSGTLRENIAFCRPDASDEEIFDAARNALIYDFIKELPDGLETKVGERGLGLSEGQIQRIAIARAFLSDAPILLLDEATSALDENTERALLENIGRMKQKTCIFISHKEGTIRMCDKIYYMNGKKFRNISFDELMECWGRTER